MPRLPPRFAAAILTFAPLFLQRSWRHAEAQLVGAILAPGRRTVASVLRITGPARERRFVNYHRVLNRATWCPRAASRILLGLLVAAFAPRGQRRHLRTLPSRVMAKVELRAAMAAPAADCARLSAWAARVACWRSATAARTRGCSRVMAAH